MEYTPCGALLSIDSCRDRRSGGRVKRLPRLSRFVMKHIAILFATGFGLGCSPVASGTVGTLWGVVIVMAVSGFAWPVQCAVALVCILIAFPVCGIAENHFGKKDDGRIVADEYLTFPLCMLGLPVEAWVVAMAFFSHRVLDIIKPPPARKIEDLHGGVGVVADDIVSSLYALALNHVLYRLVLHLGITPA